MLSNAPICPVLPVVDLNRAKKFWSEKVGLKESSKTNDDPSSVMFECGEGSVLLIYQRPAVKVEHTQAGFKVNDLDAEMKELRSRGVVFEEYDFPGLKTENGVATLGDIKSAWFKDSEGNIIAVTQM